MDVFPRVKECGEGLEREREGRKHCGEGGERKRRKEMKWSDCKGEWKGRTNVEGEGKGEKRGKKEESLLCGVFGLIKWSTFLRGVE